MGSVYPHPLVGTVRTKEFTVRRTKQIRLAVSTCDLIDAQKPDWMSYDQFVLNLLTPVGEAPVAAQPFVSLDLKSCGVGDIKTHMVTSHEELQDFKNHLKYLKRKYNLAFRYEVKPKATGFEIQVFRSH